MDSVRQISIRRQLCVVLDFCLCHRATVGFPRAFVSAGKHSRKLKISVFNLRHATVTSSRPWWPAELRRGAARRGAARRTHCEWRFEVTNRNLFWRSPMKLRGALLAVETIEMMSVKYMLFRCYRLLDLRERNAINLPH